jgi:hypothetical protein
LSPFLILNSLLVGSDHNFLIHIDAEIQRLIKDEEYKVYKWPIPAVLTRLVIFRMKQFFARGTHRTEGISDEFFTSFEHLCLTQPNETIAKPTFQNMLVEILSCRLLTYFISKPYRHDAFLSEYKSMFKKPRGEENRIVSMLTPDSKNRMRNDFAPLRSHIDDINRHLIKHMCKRHFKLCAASIRDAVDPIAASLGPSELSELILPRLQELEYANFADGYETDTSDSSSDHLVLRSPHQLSSSKSKNRKRGPSHVPEPSPTHRVQSTSHDIPRTPSMASLTSSQQRKARKAPLPVPQPLDSDSEFPVSTSQEDSESHDYETQQSTSSEEEINAKHVRNSKRSLHHVQPKSRSSRHKPSQEYGDSSSTSSSDEVDIYNSVFRPRPPPSAPPKRQQPSSSNDTRSRKDSDNRTRTHFRSHELGSRERSEQQQRAQVNDHFEREDADDPRDSFEPMNEDVGRQENVNQVVPWSSGLPRSINPNVNAAADSLREFGDVSMLMRGVGQAKNGLYAPTASSGRPMPTSIAANNNGDRARQNNSGARTNIVSSEYVNRGKRRGNQLALFASEDAGRSSGPVVDRLNSQPNKRRMESELRNDEPQTDRSEFLVAIRSGSSVPPHSTSSTATTTTALAAAYQPTDLRPISSVTPLLTYKSAMSQFSPSHNHTTTTTSSRRTTNMNASGSDHQIHSQQKQDDNHEVDVGATGAGTTTRSRRATTNVQLKSPTHNRGSPFTDADNQFLIKCYKRFGRDWINILKAGQQRGLFVGRTNVNLKDRFRTIERNLTIVPGNKQMSEEWMLNGDSLYVPGDDDEDGEQPPNRSSARLAANK